MDRLLEEFAPILDDSLGQLSASQRDHLRKMQGTIQGLRQLPIATLTKDESSALVNLPGLVKQIANELQHSATQHGLTLIVEPGPPIPLFRGDSGRTHRVIETLVTAAIRRTSRGRIVLETHRFEVREGQSDSLPLPENLYPSNGIWAAVRVSDTSPGLTPDTIRALTNDDPDPSIGQLGPGLSMGEIRMIVESVGGILWYEQTPASSTITVALPMT
jgi:signal transduction histidine kinase